MKFRLIDLLRLKEKIRLINNGEYSTKTGAVNSIIIQIFKRSSLEIYVKQFYIKSNNETIRDQRLIIYNTKQ